jgi:hypothetical protein
LELWSGSYELLAEADMRNHGLWRFQQTGHAARYVGGREQAEDAIRELAVAS